MYHENIVNTNRDRLNDMTTSEYVTELKAIMNHPFIKYIDLEKYLEHEDPVLIHFLNKIGEVAVMPSAMEIASFKCQMKEKGIETTEEMINDYIINNTKTMPVLDITTIYWQKHYVLADIKNNQIIKVHASQIKSIDR